MVGKAITIHVDMDTWIPRVEIHVKSTIIFHQISAYFLRGKLVEKAITIHVNLGTRKTRDDIYL